MKQKTCEKCETEFNPLFYCMESQTIIRNNGFYIIQTTCPVCKTECTFELSFQDLFSAFVETYRFYKLEA